MCSNNHLTNVLMMSYDDFSIFFSSQNLDVPINDIHLYRAWAANYNANGTIDVINDTNGINDTNDPTIRRTIRMV